MKKLSILVLVALAVALAAPTSGQAAPLNEVKKLTALDAQVNDQFGWSVAVSGDIAVVGAYLEDAGGSDAGAAYVYGRNAGGTGNWGQVKKLTASDPQADDLFGAGVGVSGDIAVVGAPGEDAMGNSAGAAYVFSRIQGGTDNWGQVKKLTAGDPQAADCLGASVAVSGDIAVVGAWDKNTATGAAYVFSRNQGGADNWGQVKKLTASDAQPNSYFGASVAVNGDIAVVGAWTEDSEGSNAGAAYVFSRNQGGANNWGQVKKLTASDAQADDNFGMSVGVSGDFAFVGAPGVGVGAGAAYVFGRNAGGTDNWGQVKELTISGAQAYDNFGTSVGVSGNIAVVGASLEDAAGTNAGGGYVFGRNSGGADNWGQVKKLAASDAEAGDQLGWSVAVSGDIGVVGAMGEDAGGSNAGAAYVFQPLSATVGGIAELPVIDGAPLQTSGSSGPGAGVLAGMAVAFAAGALALGGAAWYARRRWLQ